MRLSCERSLKEMTISLNGVGGSYNAGYGQSRGGRGGGSSGWGN